MSEFNPNLDKPSSDQDHTEAESQTAAAATPPVSPEPSQGSTETPAATPSPFANVDVQKLIHLLKNPLESAKLQPATDWIYSAISSAVGVIGFFFFMWALREESRSGLSSGNDFEGMLSGLANMVSTASSPFYGVFGFLTPGKYLIFSIISIAVIVGVLTLIGNWIGGRKRSWLEAATYLGGTQLLFGAGFLVSGIVAFISFELATFLGMALLALNLLVLVIQAMELHEVNAQRRFPYIYQSVGGYAIIIYVVYLIFT